MTAWAWAWVAWIFAGVTLEAVAVIRKADDDTLSENTWRLLAWLRELGPVGTAARLGLTIGAIGFFGWLILHFFLPPGTV